MPSYVAVLSAVDVGGRFVTMAARAGGDDTPAMLEGTVRRSILAEARWPRARPP